MISLYITACQVSKDIVLVLDSSTSVGPDNFKLQTDYVQARIKELSGNNQNHQFSLITYSTEVNTIFSFNRYSSTEQILNAVATTRYVLASKRFSNTCKQVCLFIT